MIKQPIKVGIKVGLHARPAVTFITTAQKFKSEVQLSKDEVEVNGKSILSVLSLAIVEGSTVILTVKGEDEIEAFESLKRILEGKNT